MTITGVDYVLKRVPRQASIRRFATAVRCNTGHPHGLTYQKCRFCDRGWPELKYLLKYGVRHYVCEDCHTHFANPRQGR